MGQLLIAVKSCHRDRKAGFHDAIRSTWGKDLGPGVVLKFFMGKNPDERESTASFHKDDIVLDCSDDYMSLPFKTREICAWQRGRMIDYTFLCDCDTIVQAKKLLALPYKQYDYSGHFCTGPTEVHTRFDYKDHKGEYPNSYPWCSGGVGYFISKDAAFDIADSYPQVWAEDMYVGQVLGPSIAKGELQAEYLELNNQATFHFRKSKMHPQFTPELLYRIHKDGGPEKLYEEAFQK